MRQYAWYALSFSLGVIASWFFISFVSDDRLLRNSMNFAQIVGVFAGLGLTAISIMAALPLDGWVTKVGRVNSERKTELVDMIKKTPDWFQENLVIQILSLTVLIVFAVLFKYEETDKTFDACRLMANCVVGGAVVVSMHSMIVLFQMLKSLLRLALKRFD